MKDRLQNISKKVGRLISANGKTVWASSFAGFSIPYSHFVIFDSYHLAYKWLGEAIIASAVYLFVYFFGKPIVFYIGAWIERIIRNALTKVLYDFWATQSAKLAESFTFKRSSSGAIVLSGSTEEDENGIIQVSSDEYKAEVAPIVLDTSAIIDGRILGVLKAGFLDGKIIVTQSAVDELKNMADKKNDSLKRDKGRRGLDILNQIKKQAGRNNFQVVEIKASKRINGAVDKSILDFCVKIKARIATLDFNLNKESQVYGLQVLNVNKLANEIKMNLAPGDLVVLKLLQEGKESGQCVGYLEDGTMIVVRDSKEFLGEHKEVIIEKVIQTDAGRMVFAHLSIPSLD
jgi:uncharacterized protein YacL